MKLIQNIRRKIVVILVRSSNLEGRERAPEFVMIIIMPSDACSCSSSEMSIPFTLVDFVRLSNLIELRNFGYKIKVCNLICCLVSLGRFSVSASLLHKCF